MQGLELPTALRRAESLESGMSLATGSSGEAQQTLRKKFMNNENY